MFLKQYSKHLVTSLAFYIFLAFIFCIYLTGKTNSDVFTQFHFLRFDAILYQDIKNNGYYQNWLCAFFPAFPFLWKWMNVSPTGIAVFNTVLFLFSSSLLAFHYKLEWKRQVFFLSIPSLIFMFVPYTESLFFFAGTLLLIGLKHNKMLLIVCALFLGSLVRPTTFIFVPAILGCWFFATHSLKEGLVKSILPVSFLLLGLFSTVYIHFIYTKEWFIFFEAQKLWQNHLHVPRLPLRSWGGDGSTRYDGSSLALAFCCGYYLFILLIKKIKHNHMVPKDLSFALLYIIGTALVVLLYRDGNLYSLNRFIYATPFIVAVLHYFFETYTFTWKHVWIVLIFTELFWLLFNSYNHIHNFLLFTTVSFYFSLLLLTKHPNKVVSTLCISLLIVINCIGLIKLFYRYLNGGWIG